MSINIINVFEILTMKIYTMLIVVENKGANIQNRGWETHLKRYFKNTLLHCIIICINIKKLKKNLTTLQNCVLGS